MGAGLTEWHLAQGMFLTRSAFPCRTLVACLFTTRHLSRESKAPDLGKTSPSRTCPVPCRLPVHPPPQQRRLVRRELLRRRGAAAGRVRPCERRGRADVPVPRGLSRGPVGPVGRVQCHVRQRHADQVAPGVAMGGARRGGVPADADGADVPAPPCGVWYVAAVAMCAMVSAAAAVLS